MGKFSRLGNALYTGQKSIDFVGQTEEERSYEERQRRPGDYEVLVSQRADTQVDLEENVLQDIFGASLIGDMPTDRAQEPVVEVVPDLFRRRNHAYPCVPANWRRGLTLAR